MSEGWETIQLNEVCSFFSGLWKGKKGPFVNVGVIRNTNFNKDGSLNDADIAYLDVEERQFSKRQLEYGDIILEKSGGGPKQPVGRVIIFDKSDGKFSLSNFTSAIRINNSKSVDFRFLHKYLHYLYLCGATEPLQRQSTGIRNLRFKEYQELEIPLPPLPEQKRIVAILDQAFEGIDRAIANAERNLANARELFESHLNAIFTQKGEGWKEVVLGEACIVERGSSPRPIKTYLTKAPDGVNWIKIGDTKGVAKYVTSTKEKITPEGALRSKRVEPGDLILTNSMSYGRPYIMATTGYIHDGWFVLRLKEDVKADFFYYLLSSRIVQEQFHSLATGSVVKNISGDLVKRAVLPVPPKEQQAEIVEAVEALSNETHRLEVVYRQKLDDLAELKQSILQKAFSGELTSVTKEGAAA